MIIHNVLNRVFSRGANIVVMRTLRNYSSGISGREVSRLSGLTPRSAIQSLTLLEDLGLVNRIRGGREHLFSLNRYSFLIQNSVLPLFQSEDDFQNSLKKEIENGLKGKALSALIFGSAARREETEESDLDLCLIYEKTKERNDLEELIISIGSRLHRKYGVNLSPLYISKGEFRKKAKSGKSPVKQIIEDGELIAGKPIKRIINA